jgi:glutamyl-tRNA synthetase
MCATTVLLEKKAYQCFCSKEKLENDRQFAKENKLTPKYNKTCLNLSDEDIQKKIENNEEFVVRLIIEPDKIFE